MENQLTLVKRQESFKLTVTENLERMIRYLCGVLPDNEYSGTLFYEVEGSFEEGNLHIIAKDFYLQDIGSGGYTEFKNDATMAGYMVEKGLFNCYQGLMHSHNKMPAFFSGTDTGTLQSEGKDANHFVSLIVNNAGAYCAAITRKVTRLMEGTTTISYNTYNNKPITTSNKCNVAEEIIEYFTLNVEKEPYSLHTRFQELKTTSSSLNKLPIFSNPIADKPTAVQLPLFKEEHMFAPTKEEDVFPESRFPKSLIKSHAAQIITGNIFAAYSANLDLSKWTKNMVNVYKRRFQDNNATDGITSFHYYADSFIESLQNEVWDDEIIKVVGNEDEMFSIWAMDLIDELTQYETNEYLSYYITSLERFIV